MSADPVRHGAPQTSEPADVTYLDTAFAQEEVSDPIASEREELRRRLDTERSAGRALLASVLELERRLGIERGALRHARRENERQWGDIHELNAMLCRAERPLWRRLLNR